MSCHAEFKSKSCFITWRLRAGQKREADPHPNINTPPPHRASRLTSHQQGPQDRSTLRNHSLYLNHEELINNFSLSPIYFLRKTKYINIWTENKNVAFNVSGNKNPSVTCTSLPASSRLLYDLVEAATFQNETFWGVAAGLEVLSKMLGKIQRKEEVVAPIPVLSASQLHCQNQ